jgi:hypothetical protein
MSLNTRLLMPKNFVGAAAAGVGGAGEVTGMAGVATGIGIEGVGAGVGMGTGTGAGVEDVRLVMKLFTCGTTAGGIEFTKAFILVGGGAVVVGCGRVGWGACCL